MHFKEGRGVGVGGSEEGGAKCRAIREKNETYTINYSNFIPTSLWS